MADEADVASNLIENALSRAIEQIRKNQPPTMGAKNCVECGDDIPLERQKMGFKFCVACASLQERRKSQYKD